MRASPEGSCVSLQCEKGSESPLRCTAPEAWRINWRVKDFPVEDILILIGFDTRGSTHDFRFSQRLQ